MFKIVYTILLVVGISGCGWSKPPVTHEITKPLETLPAQIEQVKAKVDVSVKNIKQSPKVKEVKHELVTTNQYDDFYVVEPKKVIDISANIEEAKITSETLRNERESKILSLENEIKVMKDETFKSERAILHFILYISIIAFFGGIIATYFNKNFIQVALVSCMTGLIALGILKSVGFISLVAVVATISIISIILYFFINKSITKKV